MKADMHHCRLSFASLLGFEAYWMPTIDKPEGWKSFLPLIDFFRLWLGLDELQEGDL